MSSKRPGAGVTAVLGPTNTGKTHLAIERLLAHRSGIIGLPLRLLAREVYDRIKPRCGAERVALITGEEKIIPANPCYYVCTVEAMPLDHAAEFVAIDEIQLAADPERGHVFTRRLLNARGLFETMLLGADTMRAIIAELLPGANFVSRPRFSSLSYTGRRKLSRLPRRSAIVAFSAGNVYEIAELVRRQRGGAAVVMGALSPRTRNAQVELFQSGDVDFIVATDAIGMGLNMDIDHVAFASKRKFDGKEHRDLSAAEMAQIAGRAGRHMNDGTFGESADAPDFDPEIISRIESHEFASIKCLQWRNTELDYSSIEALQQSLEMVPGRQGLVRARIGADQQALAILGRNDEIAALATGPDELRLLWDVCQLPDYRNITTGDHAGLVARIFTFLAKEGRIPQKWFAEKLHNADKTKGNIDTLSARISYIRTWTFIANSAGWLEDAAGWQGRTREMEDRLSDALHQKLISSFVDRRTSVLMKRLREREDLMAVITDEGEVMVEGEKIGELKGFVFNPSSHKADAQGKALRSAASSVLAREIPERAARLAGADDAAFELTGEGGVLWEKQPVARLKRGEDVLRAQISVIAGEHLDGAELAAVQARLQSWLDAYIKARLEPLVNLHNAQEIDGLARGLAFRLVENLGLVAREKIADDVKALDQDARGELRKYGVRFGAYSVYFPQLLKPAATALRMQLWALFQDEGSLKDVPPPPGEGLTSVRLDPALPEGFYGAAGFRICRSRAVRADMLERLADEIRPLVYWKSGDSETVRPEGSVEGGGFTVTPAMMSYVGCSGEDFAEILLAIGFKCHKRRIKAEAEKPGDGEEGAQDEVQDEFVEIWRPAPRAKKPGPYRQRGKPGGQKKTANAPERRNIKKPPRKRVEKKPDPNSPFAALQALKQRMEAKE